MAVPMSAKTAVVDVVVADGAVVDAAVVDRPFQLFNETRLITESPNHCLS